MYSDCLNVFDSVNDLLDLVNVSASSVIARKSSIPYGIVVKYLDLISIPPLNVTR